MILDILDLERVLQCPNRLGYKKLAEHPSPSFSRAQDGHVLGTECKNSVSPAAENSFKFLCYTVEDDTLTS